MSDHEKDRTDNLEFFESAILDPALKAQAFFDFDIGETDSTVSDFGAIEAAHWAWLGVRIGYLERMDTQELISSSKGIFKAWSNLQNRQIISPEDRWANVIQPRKSGQLALNKELFSPSLKIGSKTRVLLQNAFQTLLLLTAENILDDDSRYFLDSIGWTGNEEWRARSEGLGLPRRGSVQQIGSGLANVLNYWEEMDSASRSVEHADLNFAYIPEQKRDISVSFSESLAPSAAVSNFTQNARAILSPRFNLGKVEIVDRYFVLAGEFVARAREEGPAWLDARRRVFETLELLILYAGGGTNMRGPRRRLWQLFSKGIASLSENDKRSVENYLETLSEESLEEEPPEDLSQP